MRPATVAFTAFGSISSLDFRPRLVQVGCEVLAAEVVREDGAALSQFGELRAPLRMIWFSSCCGGCSGIAATRLLQAAVMKSSRSPSSTFCVSPFSTQCADP